MENTADWNFPVSLVPLMKMTDRQRVKARAVVRGDTGEGIAIVSNKYCLLKHSDIFDPIDELAYKISKLTGCKQKCKTVTGKEGAIATRTIEFEGYNKKMAQVGDTVGFRILATNSYTGQGASLLRIGGIILSCTNGMVRFDKTVGNLRVHHVEGMMNRIHIPTADDVIRSFENSASLWDQYGTKQLSDGSVRDTYLPQLFSKGLVTKREMEAITQKKHKTAWDLMQDITYQNTHMRPRLNGAGRVEVMAQTDSWFERTFM
jgi:hypothetical protein